MRSMNSRWTYSKIAFLYIICLLPGLSAIAGSFSNSLCSSLLGNLGNLPNYTWVVMPSTPKIQGMLEYTALTVMLSILIITAFSIVRLASLKMKFSQSQYIILYYYFIACAALSVFMPNSYVNTAWVGLAGVFPAYIITQLFSCHRPTRVKRIPAYIWLCVLILITLVGFLYATAWSPNLRFRNDFIGLPEYTQMSNGRLVENNVFLQKYGVVGRSVLDPCKGKLHQGLCISMPRTVFRSAREAFNLFPSGSGLNYSWDDEKLRAYRAPTYEELLLIDALLQTPPKMNSHYPTNTFATSKSVVYPINVYEFLQKNRNSLAAQELLGRFFYHHAYLYLPIVQTILRGTSDSVILPSQYGTGLTKTFAKILKWTGNYTFQNYFTLYWLGPGFYIALSIFVTYILTRQVNIAIAIAAFIIILLPFDSMDGLRLAPGFNPWRHLPDLLCFLSIGIYVARQSYVTILSRAISITFFFWWNREFGLFMLLGSIVWHIFTVMHSTTQLRKTVICVISELAGCGLVVALASKGGANELAFYNLLGVGAPITRWNELIYSVVISLLLIGSAVWAKFFTSSQSKSYILDVAGVGFCYSAFAAVYALWNPSPGHISVIWVCASLPLICLAQWYFEVIEQRLNVTKNWLNSYTAVVLVSIAFTSSVFAAINTEVEFKSLFHDHLTFNWKFPGIIGQTTADPALVEQSLALVKKEQPSGDLVIISKYDVLIHIASGRLSMLPYVDLPSAVISWQVIDAIASRIETLEPQVIFIDRDIFANQEWQLLGNFVSLERNDFYQRSYRTPGVRHFMFNNFLMEQKNLEYKYKDTPRCLPPSYHRVGHQAALAMLARKVIEQYEPGPSSGLLQAWYRRSKEQ